MSTLAVRRPDFQCRDDLAISLQLIARSPAWLSAIAAMQRTRPELLAERAVDRVVGNAMQVCAVHDQMPPFFRSGRQLLQFATKQHQRLIGRPFAAHLKLSP
jgi:hypothetical protein